MLLAAATSSQLLNLPVLQLPCPVSCTCCEGPTGLESGIRRYSFVATSKIISIAFSSACYSCNIATVRSVRHDGSTAAARSLPGWRSKVVDGLWGGGENSCREPFSQLRRLYGARPLPSTVSMASTALPFERRSGASPILDLRCRHLAARLHERHRADARRCQPHTRPGVDAPATDWCPYATGEFSFGSLRIRVVSGPGPRRARGLFDLVRSSGDLCRIRVRE